MDNKEEFYKIGFSDDDLIFDYTDIEFTRTFKVSVKNFNFEFLIRMSVEMVQDFHIFYGSDYGKAIERSLKNEAIEKILSDKQFIRKLKLRKINEKKV